MCLVAADARPALATFIPESMLMPISGNRPAGIDRASFRSFVRNLRALESRSQYNVEESGRRHEPRGCLPLRTVRRGGLVFGRRVNQLSGNKFRRVPIGF